MKILNNWYVINLHLNYEEQRHIILFTDNSQGGISSPDSSPECQTQISNFVHEISIWTDLKDISIFIPPQPDSWHLPPKQLLLKPFPSQSLTTILSVTQVKNQETIVNVSFSQPFSQSVRKAPQWFLWRCLPESDYFLSSPSLPPLSNLSHHHLPLELL